MRAFRRMRRVSANCLMAWPALIWPSRSLASATRLPRPASWGRPAVAEVRPPPRLQSALCRLRFALAGSPDDRCPPPDVHDLPALHQALTPQVREARLS